MRAWGLRLLRLGRYGHRGTRMAVVKLRLVEKGHIGGMEGGAMHNKVQMLVLYMHVGKGRSADCDDVLS